MNFKIIILVIINFLLANSAFARWATSDESEGITTRTIQYLINDDGTYLVDYNYRIVINNENAKIRNLRWSRLYQREAEQFKLISTHVIGNDGIKILNNYRFEDKEVNSPSQIIKNQNSASIIYHDLRIGDVLERHFQIKKIQAIVPGIYSLLETFGEGVMEKNSRVVFRSKSPLKPVINDPNGIFEVIENRTSDWYQIEVIQKMAAFYATKSESGSRYLPQAKIPFIGVTNLNSHEEWAKYMAMPMEKILSEPLPPLFEDIVNKAKNEVGFINQANRLHVLLAESIRYLGDFRLYRGGWIPHSLAEIAANKYGDCKDHSIVLAAMLRKLGYDAKTAEVNRGDKFVEVNLIPGPKYNHEITYVKVGGRDYWLDGTNPMAFVQGVPPDIAGRPALIDDIYHPQMIMIPSPSPDANEYEVIQTIDLKDNGNGIIQHQINIKGLQAFYYTALEKILSKKQINESLIKFYADSHIVKNFAIEPYNMSDRIVKDITLRFSLELESILTETTMGNSYQLSVNPFEFLNRLQPNNEVSDIYLGNPNIYKSQKIFRRQKLIGNLMAPCHIKSPWFDFDWEIFAKNGDVIVTSQTTQKSNLINIGELNSKPFLDLRDHANRCSKTFALLLQPLAN